MIHYNRLKFLDARRPLLRVLCGFTMLFSCLSSDCLFSQYFIFLNFFSSNFRSKNFKIVRLQKRRSETKHVILALFCSFSVPTMVRIHRFQNEKSVP